MVSKRINLSVTKKYYDKIKKISKETGVPMAKMVLMALAKMYNLED